MTEYGCISGNIPKSFSGHKFYCELNSSAHDAVYDKARIAFSAGCSLADCVEVSLCINLGRIEENVSI